MRRVLSLVLPALLLSVFAACSDPCAIPMETAPSLRILNAMADESVIRVELGNRPVYSNLAYTDQKWYTTTYEDKSNLVVGSQRLVVLNAAGDTILKQQVQLTSGRQTMIITGRARQRVGNTPAPTRAIMLNDLEGQEQIGKNVIRFVHAMPDLDSVDIYFTSKIENATPFQSLAFGQKSDYFVLAQINGLTITAKGDKSKVVFQIDESFNIVGIFGTVVIRGSSDPHGNEPLPSPVVLSDTPLGSTYFSITSIFIRFVNGARDSTYSLMAKGDIADAGPRGDINGQDSVLCRPSVSASAYWSITNQFHGKANWYISTWCHSDTMRIAHTWHDELQDLHRYSFVAVQDNKLGDPNQVSHLRLEDTMTTPKDKAFGRVRFVNLSPDVDVTIPYTGQTLKHKEIAYVDLPVGAKSFVANGKTISFTVTPDDPKTVWFCAATASNPLPYLETHD